MPDQRCYHQVNQNNILSMNKCVNIIKINKLFENRKNEVILIYSSIIKTFY